MTSMSTSMRHTVMYDNPVRTVRTERAAGITLTWYLVQGARGAVQLLLMVPSEKLRIPTMALDLGIHSPRELYEGQDHMTDCPHVPGGICYYSGSTKLAGQALAGFQRSNDPEVIWVRLEAAYAIL